MADNLSAVCHYVIQLNSSLSSDAGEDEVVAHGVVVGEGHGGVLPAGAALVTDLEVELKIGKLRLRILLLSRRSIHPHLIVFRRRLSVDDEYLAVGGLRAVLGEPEAA